MCKVKVQTVTKAK